MILTAKYLINNIIVAVLMTVILCFIFAIGLSYGEPPVQTEVVLPVQDSNGRIAAVPEEPDAKDGQEQLPRVADITVPIGSLYTRPSIDSVVAGSLNKGDMVTLIHRKDEWYVVKDQDDMLSWAHISLFSDPYETGETGSGMLKEVKEILVDITPQGEEKVIFKLNGFYPPEMFPLEGDRPRIVCDFLDIHLNSRIACPIEVNGRLIKRIRAAHYKGAEPKTRIVLDLVSEMDYEVGQYFFKDEQLYTLVVKPAQKISVDQSD